MTNKKIIFIIISAIFFVIIVFLLLSLNGKDPNTRTTKGPSGDFKIWVIGDDKTKFNGFLNNFKLANAEHEKTIFSVESFDNYEVYELALASAISKGEGPDLFVLNNNTSSFLDEQILGIDPKIINPNDFRKKYKGVFGDELILSSEVEEGGRPVEFLKGVPVGYETLGIYYNKRYAKASDLGTMAGLNNVVSEIKKKKSSLIPIGIGNGSTVVDSADIITQLFMLEDANSLSEVSGNKVKESFGTYFMYGNRTLTNRYNTKFISMKQDGKSNLDLFTDSIVTMVIGYPSMLETISKNGYNKSFLDAVPFPHHFEGVGKSLLNYNYFVINKDSVRSSTALDLLQYISTDRGATEYLNTFRYYLPALLSLESDLFDQKIDPGYNIILRDFLDENSDLSSFDKGLKSIYDREIIKILDDENAYEELFKTFKTGILCKKTKIINLKSLSSICD